MMQWKFLTKKQKLGAALIDDILKTQEKHLDNKEVIQAIRNILSNLAFWNIW